MKKQDQSSMIEDEASIAQEFSRIDDDDIEIDEKP